MYRRSSSINSSWSFNEVSAKDQPTRLSGAYREAGGADIRLASGAEECGLREAIGFQGSSRSQRHESCTCPIYLRASWCTSFEDFLITGLWRLCLSLSEAFRLTALRLSLTGLCLVYWDSVVVVVVLSLRRSCNWNLRATLATSLTFSNASSSTGDPFSRTDGRS